jgi:integrase/recombinase XerC
MWSTHDKGHYHGAMSTLVPVSAFAQWPPAVAAAPPDVQHAILQFFAAEIRNPNTRRAYLRAAHDFFAHAGVMSGGQSLAGISSLHVSSWIEVLSRGGLSAPTIKLRLAGVRMLFQALVRERILAVNPAAVVRGPKHVAKRGKTPVLAADEARQILDVIDVRTIAGLRDRALIGTMIYTFARIGAVTAMTVGDVFWQQRRLWLRLHEKGGKRHEVPAHHVLQDYLTDYMTAAGIGHDADVALFQTLAREASSVCRLSGKAMTQPIAWEMLQRRAKSAGICTRVCNHTFRATGITTYLKNGGTIERAATMANHSSTRTTQLYDRRPDDVTLEEVERIRL